MTFLTLLTLAGSLFVVLVVIELIRGGRLKEKYALLWLFSSFVMLVISVARPFWEKLSLAVGVYYPPSFLFLAAIAFLILINLHYSTVISDLTDKNNRLAQEIALMKSQMDRRSAAERRDG